MNKALKILIMFFTVVCFIVLVVFCVELVLQNRGVERGVIQAPAAADDYPNDERSDYNDNDEYEPPDEEELPEEEVPEPLLERFEFEIPNGGFVLRWYVDINRFGHNYGEILEWFVYSDGDATAFLEVHMVQIPEEYENYAVVFMENRFEVQGVPDEEHTYITIGNSGLSGIYAKATAEEEIRFETWILANPHTPNLGVAITIRYRDYEQFSALEAILDSMQLLPINGMDDNDVDTD